MDRFVESVAQLRHAEAMSLTKTGLKDKKGTGLRKALSLLVAVEQAYYEGKVLVSDKSPHDIQLKYKATGQQLQQAKTAISESHTERDNGTAMITSLQKYCDLRCELAGVYRALERFGINFVDYIPKLRSLLTAATDLKPQDTRSPEPAAQAELHLLVQLEIQFMLSLHECLWEVNRLQSPAAVVHLSFSRKKLRQLMSLSDTSRKSMKLLLFLESLYASAYSKVTLVFLEALGKPVHADLCSEHDFDDAVSRIKESIDHAGLHPLWTLPGRSRIRSGFALLGYDTEGLASNVLRALDALRDEAHAKLGVRPTLHILYNAAAHGFSSTFNLSNNRVALPRYLACGQRELPENESLTGLKGFPSVATYPPGETCPQEVVALLAPMPLMDAGNAALSPSRVVVEEVDRFRDERSREQRLRAMSLRRGSRTPRQEALEQPAELLAGEVDPSEVGDQEDVVAVEVAPLRGGSPEMASTVHTARTVAAVRIDLLFYAALVFEGTNHNVALITEWLQCFAKNAISGNIEYLSYPTRDIKA